MAVAAGHAASDSMSSHIFLDRTPTLTIFPRITLFPFHQQFRSNGAPLHSFGHKTQKRVAKRHGDGGAVGYNLTIRRRTGRRGVICAAYVGKGSAIDHGYDLYDLLGVESEAPLPEIKKAYRWLQKRCHPDIAGPVGHDMAILLNDAYTTLSDPIQRAAYNIRRADRAEFDGFTGEPMYSKWLGSAKEDRAVFVDETRCVGCLKCALIASNTFAIENQYGRARVVGQWGDSESTIKDAIRACPVDCISWVDRDQLAALEFIMSKQPRLPGNVDVYSHGGQRTENVFITAERFLRKCAQREQAKASNIQETPDQREARMAAADAIQARAGRWWHLFVGKNASQEKSFRWDPDSGRALQGAIIPLEWVAVPKSDTSVGVSSEFQYRRHTGGPAKGAQRGGHDESYFSFIPEELSPLYEAAAQRRQMGASFQRERSSRGVQDNEEYWTPTEPVISPLSSSDSSPRTRPRREEESIQKGDSRWAWISEMPVDDLLSGWMKSLLSVAPVLASITAAIVVGMTSGIDTAQSSEVRDAMGPLPAEITSGVVMQMFLAAAVWYIIGAVCCSVTMVLATLFVVWREKKSE